MGIVIKFPARERGLRPGRTVAQAARGQVVILPVIRIDRYAQGPGDLPVGGRRRRRRRASQS